VVSLCNAELRAGAVVSADEHNVRIRTLPLVKGAA
jgi:hypothetical protein